MALITKELEAPIGSHCSQGLAARTHFFAFSDSFPLLPFHPRNPGPCPAVCSGRIWSARSGNYRLQVVWGLILWSC
jgi:hypothetical protein